MYTIDLNSDMGESFGAYRIGNDEGIGTKVKKTARRSGVLYRQS